MNSSEVTRTGAVSRPIRWRTERTNTSVLRSVRVPTRVASHVRLHTASELKTQVRCSRPAPPLRSSSSCTSVGSSTTKCASSNARECSAARLIQRETVLGERPRARAIAACETPSASSATTASNSERERRSR